MGGPGKWGFSIFFSNFNGVKSTILASICLYSGVTFLSSCYKILRHLLNI